MVEYKARGRRTYVICFMCVSKLSLSWEVSLKIGNCQIVNKFNMLEYRVTLQKRWRKMIHNQQLFSEVNGSVTKRVHIPFN